jgi:hypothetical protein
MTFHDMQQALLDRTQEARAAHQLEYGAIADRMAELGNPEKTPQALVGFQKFLYPAKNI